MDLKDYRAAGHSEFVANVLIAARLENGMAEKKAWGAAVAIHLSRWGQLSLAILNRGGFCSRHYHRTKTNVFTVLNGELEVSVWDHDFGADVDPPDHRRLVMPGQSLAIAPNVIHMMAAKTNCVCMESYHTEVGGKVCPKDIYRLTKGGLREFQA